MPVGFMNWQAEATARTGLAPFKYTRLLTLRLARLRDFAPTPAGVNSEAGMANRPDQDGWDKAGAIQEPFRGCGELLPEASAGSI